MNIASFSYGIAAGAFFILSLLLVTSWRGHLQGALLAAAAMVTGLWAASITAMQSGLAFMLLPSAILEVIRDLSWALFLMKLLDPRPGWRGLLAGRLRWWLTGLMLLGIVLVSLIVIGFLRAKSLPTMVGVDAHIIGHLALALVGLVLVEQLFRNTRPENRWAIKYLCLGVGGLFAYDFYLYSDALLFKRIDVDLWLARGMINALVVPLIAVSAARNPEWSLDVFVSRRMVFHSAAVLGAGIYLLAMAAGGAYVRVYGGNWGHVAQAVFLFGALVVLLVVLFSGHAQARLKVFLNKHFFNYKYDYREEWLRFIRTLSAGEPGMALRERVIEAIANIMDSPGGALWWRREPGRYEFVAHWNMSEVDSAYENADGSLAQFLAARNWVVDLHEYGDKPEAYAALQLPQWLRDLRRAWLVVPLMHHEGLVGFVVLARPRAARACNWEDNDLLKTAGREAASHLAQMEAAEALVNARQFEAFNRLSAFLIHDMKNVVAQLSLVVNNAAKFKHKPEFVEDAFKTIENAALKMNHVLNQLRSGTVARGRLSQVDLQQLLTDVVAAHRGKEPVPALECRARGLVMSVVRDKLADVLSHIIQNAQEATPADGRIEVVLQNSGSVAVIEVRDTGCGMDGDFIRNRLFRPFDSTKGRSGMGVGAYEAREFVRELGGQLDVESERGVGTCFRIRLPLEAESSKQYV
ncbi:MAG: PEP-CTERM system histidine kinase PrsK [Gammaproteobacteria bacterium]